MKKKLLAIILSLALLISAFPPLSTVATASGSFVTVLQDGEAVSAISVPENEERLLTGSVSGIAAENYNWQIKIANTNIWVNIDGRNSSECAVSNALVGSMLDGSGTAYLRLAVTASGNIYTSDPVAVTITEPEPGIEAEEPEPMDLEGLEITIIDLDPTEEASEPTEAPSEPTEAPSQPTEAPSEPTEAPSEPTEVPSEPTEAPSEPTEVPSEPTEAPSEPTEAPSEPTEAPSEPTEAPSEATEESSEPTETVEPITEPEIETTQAPETEESGEAVPEAEPLAVSTLSQQTWSAQPLVMASSQQEYQLVMLSSIEEPDTDESETPSDPVAPIADGDEEGGDGDGDGGTTTPSTPSGSTTTYDVVVQFLYSDDTQVRQPFMANIAAGEELHREVVISSVVGYAPYYDSNNNGFYDDNEKLTVENDGNYHFWINLEEVNRTYNYTIRFRADEVEYKVEHYVQNRSDDQYTLAQTDEKKGLTNSYVPDNLALTGGVAAGHTAQSYEQVTIAADGSTVVKIYYLINYYLVEFDLGEGAYGVEPVYVRYGTTVTVGRPTHPGYSFNSWELAEVNGVQATTTQQQTHVLQLNAGNSTYTVVVPAANLKYRAVWSTGASSFTVVYWRETETAVGYSGETEYEYWGSQPVGGIYTEDGQLYLDNTVTSGDTIDLSKYTTIPTDIATTADGLDESFYFHYNGDKTNSANPANLTVAGDHTTVVNVYFDRNEYTLKFYYAAKEGSTNYVFGRTNPFGSEASNRIDRNDEIALLDGAWNAGQYSFIKAATDSIPTVLNGKYTTGTDTGANNRTYYYFTFKAKYGADISEYWPTAEDISTVGTTNTRLGDAVFSAWDGEYNVYYTQHNNLFGSNETIKGQYRRLDYRILWDTSLAATKDPSVYNNTVAYLAYWNNVVNQSYNIPTLYRYNIYLECVEQHGEGETCALCSDAGPKFFAVDGTTKSYFRASVYDVADNRDTSGTGNLQQQTHPDVRGFTNVNDTNGTGLTSSTEYITLSAGTGENQYNSSVYESGFEIYWFYDRIRYPLTFVNMGEILMLKDANGNFMEAQDVRYGVSLYSEGGYDIDELENYNNTSYYPESLPENAYEFEGWYTTPTFASSTKFTFSESSTMPASPLTLYAHWVPKQFKVSIYEDFTAMVNNQPWWSKTEEDGTVRDYTLVNYGEHAPSPGVDVQPEDTAVLHFVGWFYLDENNEEQAWDFSSMVVTHDMKIYAKWSSSKTRPYIIYYKLRNEDGSDGPEVAKSSTGTELVGASVTVRPKTGTQLYAAYQQHYFPEGDTHSLTIVEDTAENTYTVYYDEAQSIPYTVHYVDQSGNTIHDDKKVELNPYSIVTEVFEPISGYMPDAYSKRLVVSLNEDGTPNTEHNVITFVYTVNDEQTYYKYEHYVQAEQGAGYVLYSEQQVVGDIDTTISVNVLNMTGFTYRSDLTKVTADETPVTNFSDNGSTVSATLTSDGLLFQLYYDRQELSYKVHYREVTTEKELAESKVVTVRYGASVTERGIDIKGYELITQPIPSIITTDAVELVFHYQETTTPIYYIAIDNGSVDTVSESVDTVSGPAMGSTPTANGGYHFAGWYQDEACRIPVDPTWVDTGTEENPGTNKLTPQPEKENPTDKTAYFVGRTYYALFERNTADLTISTTFPANNNYRDVDGSQTFVFQITGTGSNAGISLTVTLHERESKTIADLPTGTYTVTELTSSAWRYGADSGTKSVEVRPNQTNSVQFVETRNQLYWLDGNAIKAVNSFTALFDPEQEGGV